MSSSALATRGSPCGTLDACFRGMRSHLEFPLISAMGVLTMLALVGCGLSGDRRIGTTQTTTAAVASTESVQAPSPSACVPNVPLTSLATLPTGEGDFEALRRPPRGPNMGVTSMQGEPRENIYARPPLHEPNGSPRYSDVGMPYPIPAAIFDTPPPAATPIAPPPAPPPFFESSFGRSSPSSNGFPESSFGPDAEP
jgi:hypothetical protein